MRLNHATCHKRIQFTLHWRVPMTRSLSITIAAMLMSGIALPASAQVIVGMQPAVQVVQPASRAGYITLRQGASIPLRLTTGLSSKHSRPGERFNLEVSDAVRVNGVTVIPAGSRAIGEVTRVVKKGAFGKSGKIDIRLLNVSVGGEQIRLDGTAHDAGEGGTVATVGVAIAAGIFSAFVTGKSAELPVGSSLTGYTAEDVTVMVQTAAYTPLQGR